MNLLAYYLECYMGCVICPWDMLRFIRLRHPTIDGRCGVGTRHLPY